MRKYFLHNVAALSPVLMPLCRWRYGIPFQHASAKSECGQFRRLQKAPPQINWLS